MENTLSFLLLLTHVKKIQANGEEKILVPDGLGGKNFMG